VPAHRDVLDAPESLDSSELAEETRRAVRGLLPPRAADTPAVVLGAGSDDLESGRHHLQLLAEGGWAVPTWPVSHGGRGCSSSEGDVVAAVLGEFEAPTMYPFLVGLHLIGPTILMYGTEEQKARWLPSMRSGQHIWCQLFSEPDAGSDLANLKTQASFDGEAWHISGSKVWTSRAHYSRYGMLLARSDPSVPKHAGITAFCIDMESPGVTVRPLVQMNGDSHFNEVFLDEVVVPDTDRLGNPGDGWRVGLTTLSFERGSLSGDMGVSMDAIERLAARYDLKANPVARDRLMRAVIELKICGYSALRTQAERAAGKPAGPEGSLAKLRSGRMIKAISALGVDLGGPASTVVGDEPDEWYTMWLASPSLSIRGGTDEIQHNILGERILGLPPEPRVDKGKPFSERLDR
jgi:alkylation response protein AidB-like acyl-CoA dehydrogenase